MSLYRTLRNRYSWNNIVIPIVAAKYQQFYFITQACFTIIADTKTRLSCGPLLIPYAFIHRVRGVDVLAIV